ncbi:MAG: hypothetical protein ACLFM0_09585 [Spirochaetales bacterium]
MWLLALGLFAVFLAVSPRAHAIDDLFEERDDVSSSEERDGDNGDNGDNVDNGDEEGSGDSLEDEFFEEEDEAASDEAESGQSDSGNGESDGDGDYVDVDALTTSPTEFSAQVSAGIGAAASLLEWPWTDGTGGGGASDLLDYAAGYDLSSSFEIDSRPSSNIRFNVTFDTKLDENAMAFTRPAVTGLYVDYTPWERLSLRAGKYGLTWGQGGRVLDNIGNLVSDVSDGVALRGVVPIGRGTATGVVYSQEDWVSERDPQDPRAFAYAGQVETSLRRVSVGASARIRSTDPLDTSAYIAGGLGEFDWTLEATKSWDRTDWYAFDRRPNLEVMSQLLWEGGDPSWVIVGEHLWDAGDSDPLAQRVGLAVRMPRFSALGENWRPQTRIRHALKDNSGEVVTGFNTGILDNANLTVGVPFRYGPADGIYRKGDFGGDLQNIDGVAAFGLAASLSFSL